TGVQTCALPIFEGRRQSELLDLAPETEPAGSRGFAAEALHEAREEGVVKWTRGASGVVTISALWPSDAAKANLSDRNGRQCWIDGQTLCRGAVSPAFASTYFLPTRPDSGSAPGTVLKNCMLRRAQVS